MTGRQAQAYCTSGTISTETPTESRTVRACGCVLAALITAVAHQGLVTALGGSARAEPAEAASPIPLGTRAGIAPEGEPPAQERAADSLEWSERAGFTSDYIYRGVTLSDRKPAVGAGLEATLGPLYAGTTFASVKLPSQPAGEVTVSSGARKSLWNIDFDFGWTYFMYPHETPGSPGIDYLELGGRADAKLTDLLRIAAGYAYSPDFSHTGAWSQYVAFGAGIDLPRSVLPQKLSASLTAGAGYYWFGHQSPELGGFPLPAYFNWNAGVTLTRSIFNLD